MEGAESWSQVGARIREARVALGLSQSQLAEHIHVDRSALARIESGQRQVSALELFRLADELGVPVAHLVSAPIPAIVSNRADIDEDAQRVARDRYRLDAALETYARDAEFLREHGYLPAGRVPTRATNITRLGEARELARSAREGAGFPHGPLPGMASVSETFGLYTLVVDLPGEGASLRLDDQFGVTVIGAHAPAGRRRFTAAHELGHHLLGDEYQSDVGVGASRDEREQLIDAFAAELLLPGAEAMSQWKSHDGTARELLVELAAMYRVSWSVAVNSVLQAGMLESDDARVLRADTPRRGDFLAVFGAEPMEDLTVGQTGPVWLRSVLDAYRQGIVTPSRAVELLHGALDETELPDRQAHPQP